MVELINHMIVRRHFWREINFNELSELYLSTMIRALALSIVGIFVPVYFYQIGFSVSEIALYFAGVYGVRIYLDILSAKVIGYFGPKHMMVLSQLFLIIQLLLLSTLQSYNWPLWFVGGITAISSSLFYISYHIDFSKINKTKHAGHELSVMYQLTAVAGALGPLIGGAIATIWDIKYSFIVALIVVLISTIPLMMSPEPVRRHQHVTYKGFPWKKVKWDVISNMGHGFNQISWMLVWPLYISIFIFSNDIYLSVGLVTTLSLIVTITITKIYGKVVDKNKGKLLLNLSAAGTSIANLARLFVSTTGGVVIYNMFAEPLKIGVHMPYTKGLYDKASSLPGYRDIYIGTIISSSNVVRCTAWLLVFVVSLNNTEQVALQMVFVFAAATIWLTTLQRFKALQ